MHACESFARTEKEAAAQLVGNGAPVVLVSALKTDYGFRPDCRGHIATALLYMSEILELREGLMKAGVPEALQV